jgi:DNA-binding LacI/PurR family transcriptional regulator
MMVERGCKRIGVILRENHRIKHVENLRFYKAYQNASAEYGFKTMPMIEAGDISLEDGREVARRLLKMPAKQRPDGLMVINDMLAAGLTDVLRDTQAYRPQIAVQTNTPGSLIFGIPVIRFDVDVYHLARDVVRLLQTVWQQPSLDSQCRWAAPFMAHERARDMQIPAMAMAE